MKTVNENHVVLLIVMGLIGVGLTPFAQSMETDHHEARWESMESRSPVHRLLKKSLRDHFDTLHSILKDSSIFTLIKDQVQSSPLWDQLSAFMFEQRDERSFLKQHVIHKDSLVKI